jgi:hypothetical protein
MRTRQKAKHGAIAIRQTEKGLGFYLVEQAEQHYLVALLAVNFHLPTA